MKRDRFLPVLVKIWCLKMSCKMFRTKIPVFTQGWSDVWCVWSCLGYVTPMPTSVLLMSMAFQTGKTQTNTSQYAGRHTHIHSAEPSAR